MGKLDFIFIDIETETNYLICVGNWEMDGHDHIYFFIVLHLLCGNFINLVQFHLITARYFIVVIQDPVIRQYQVVVVILPWYFLHKIYLLTTDLL